MSAYNLIILPFLVPIRTFSLTIGIYATTLPVFSDILCDCTPLVALPFAGYLLSVVRLEKPYSVILNMSQFSVILTRLTAESPSDNFIPITPKDVLPVFLIKLLLNLSPCPFAVPINTSSFSVTRLASTSLWPSLRPMTVVFLLLR